MATEHNQVAHLMDTMAETTKRLQEQVANLRSEMQDMVPIAKVEEEVASELAEVATPPPKAYYIERHGLTEREADLYRKAWVVAIENAKAHVDSAFHRLREGGANQG